jgi:hypothetical protein
VEELCFRAASKTAFGTNRSKLASLVQAEAERGDKPHRGIDDQGLINSVLGLGDATPSVISRRSVEEDFLNPSGDKRMKRYRKGSRVNTSKDPHVFRHEYGGDIAPNERP